MSLGLLLDVDEYGEALHLALLEFTDIHVPVRVLEGALAVFFAIAELSPIFSVVFPFHLAFSLNFAIMELSFIFFGFFFEVVDSDAFEDAVDEFALVKGAVGPHELALAVLLAVDELALVGLGAVVPDLLADAVLLVLAPLALVLAAVEVLEDAEPRRLPVLEVPYVKLPVREDLTSLAVRIVILKLAFVLGAIRPKHHSHAITHFLMFEPKDM